MTKRLPPMIDDPNEPQHVRDLLDAGREFRVTDYDFDAGLTEHLGAVEAGAPMPEWAKALESTGSAGAPVAAGAAGSTLVGWVALPIITAAVITAVVLSSDPQPHPQPAAPAMSSTAGGQAAPDEASPSEPPESAGGQPAPAAPAVAEPLGVAAAREPGQVARASAPASRAAAPARSEERSGAIEPQRARRGERARAGATTASEAQNASVESGAAVGGKATPPALEARAAEATTPTPMPLPTAKSEAAAEQTEPGPQAEQPARPEPEPARVDDVRLEREMSMLAVAQRVLHSDTERALELARQGESEFPRSMFTQERQQVLLLALVKLGRLEEAKRLAKPYLARYPNGPFSDRVRRAIATGRVER